VPPRSTLREARKRLGVAPLRRLAESAVRRLGTPATPGASYRTAAVRLGGIPEAACRAFEGATNAIVFETYNRRWLAPTLRPGDILVMDNLSSHKRTSTIAAIESAGASAWFLPTYSPDLNPIEKMLSKLKACLRKAKARSVESFYEALGDRLQTITASDIAGWFRSCGYRQTQ
jgi:transposase